MCKEKDESRIIHIVNDESENNIDTTDIPTIQDLIDILDIPELDTTDIPTFNDNDYNLSLD